MPEKEPPTLRITDPQSIRALAHPLRLQLIDVLGEEPELTATRCAELTGESVASCSFHLRMLAKYGYVEPGERRGREKPWRLVSSRQDMRPDVDDAASVRAVEALAAVVVEREAARTLGWLRRMPNEAPDWVDASTISRSSFWATAEELAEVSATLQAIAERFAGRWEKPGERPEGARPVRVFATAMPDAEQETAR
ncbi:MAG: helix-turn-helix domain-containing protein [Jiangellaceae bacterium]